jgi:hypothetical protein
VTTAFDEDPPGWCVRPEAKDPTLDSELESLKLFAQSVNGWLSEPQGIALYRLAARDIAGDVLELGSFCGKSTMFLALGCKHTSARVVAVDPHKANADGGKEQYGPDFQPRSTGTWEEFSSNMSRSGLSQYVEPFVGTSEEARKVYSSLHLKLLFVDGSHDFPDVLLDYEIWNDMIVPGGYLVFHDSNFDGVNRVLHQHLDRIQYSYDGTIDRGGWAMTLWQKRDPTRSQQNQA